jgi:hypothetical protein
MCGFAGTFLAAMLVAALSSEALADVRDYIRWKANGQLDYRLLLRRYMPVSSFRYGREWYGYPYSAYGGLLNPDYDPTYVVVPVYYYPRNPTRPCPTYSGPPLTIGEASPYPRKRIRALSCLDIR